MTPAGSFYQIMEASIFNATYSICEHIFDLKKYTQTFLGGIFHVCLLWPFF